MAQQVIDVVAKVTLNTQQLSVDLNAAYDQAKAKIQNKFANNSIAVKIGKLSVSSGQIQINNGLQTQLQGAINRAVKNIKLNISNLKIDQGSLKARSEQIGKNIATTIMSTVNRLIRNGGDGNKTVIQLKPNFKVDTSHIDKISTNAAKQFAKSFQTALRSQKFTITPQNFIVTSGGIPLAGGTSGKGSGSSGKGGSTNQLTPQMATAKQLEAELRSLLTLYQKAEQAMNSMKNMAPNTQGYQNLDNSLTNTKTRIDALVQSTNTLRQALGNAFLTSSQAPSSLLGVLTQAGNKGIQYQQSLKDFATYTNQVKARFEELQRIQGLYQQSKNSYQQAWSSGNAGSSEYSRLTADAKLYRDQAEAALQAYRNLQQQQKMTGAAANQEASVLAQINRLRDAGAKLEAKTSQATQKVVTDYNALLAKMHQFQNLNAQALTNTMPGMQLQNLINTVTGTINNGTMDAQSLAIVSQQFAQIQASAQAAMGGVNSFGSSLLQLMGRAAQWFGVTQVIIQTMNTIRNMWANVKEIDKGMTELRKVTDESEATYAQFIVDAGTEASKLGATLSDVVSSTGDFARLGYNLKEAFNLSESATILRTVGDDIDNIDDASDALISTMSAFKIEASDSLSIVDKLNEVGNNFSSSSGDLAEGLKRSSAALAVAGNDINQSIGLVVAGNEATRNAEVVGTALKLNLGFR